MPTKNFSLNILYENFVYVNISQNRVYWLVLVVLTVCMYRVTLKKDNETHKTILYKNIFLKFGLPQSLKLSAHVGSICVNNSPIKQQHKCLHVLAL